MSDDETQMIGKYHDDDEDSSMYSTKSEQQKDNKTNQYVSKLKPIIAVRKGVQPTMRKDGAKIVLKQSR